MLFLLMRATYLWKKVENPFKNTISRPFKKKSIKLKKGGSRFHDSRALNRFVHMYLFFFFWCSSSFLFSSFCLRWIWCSRWIWYSWWSNRFDTIRSIRLLLHHSGLHQLIIKPIMLHQGGLKYECFDVHCNCQHDDQWQEFWRVVHVWKQQHNDSVLISDTKFEVRLS